MSEHAPGPWTISPNSRRVVLGADGTRICEANTNNAQLIAAAYDLLRALVAAQKALAMMIDPTAIKATSVIFAFANCTEAERMSRAALAKAKGEQP